MNDLPGRLATSLADRYRLERELGAGGMATVYLAHDLRHDRPVAIKVLRPELAAVIGAERFLSEIRTTANLQHPHILPLHDSGEADGFLFYVMPYVEGESLRDRLAREKQLPVPEALRIAGEVASALDYAHRRGVIHRDIKPENILLHDGRALIADFGIALAASRAGGSRMTETGMSLGTPHYMSPEQAMGEREITPRSDVYALGCVLYEMLVGDPPFTGSTAQAVVAKVVTAQPDPPRAHRQTIPPHVEAAVLTALQKLPADRFATAAEFASALERPGATTAATVPIASGFRPAHAGPWRGVALASAGVALAAMAFAAWASRGAGDTAPTRRYALSLGATRWSGDPFRNGLALSPAGDRFVYTGPGSDGTALWLRRRDQLESTPLPGTANAIHPFFSPDGTRLGFILQGLPIRILVMGFSGSPPTTLADSAVGLDGASWADDGFVYYDGLTQGGTRGLMRVRETGGPAEQVTTVDTAGGEADHMRPEALPGGRGVLFTLVRRDQSRTTDIAVLDLRSGRTRVLVAGVAARWLAPGHLLYLTREGVLLAAPFDLERLEITGEPVALADGGSPLRSASVHLATSAGGTLMYVTEETASRRRAVVRVGMDGSTSPYDPDWRGDMRSLAIAPDGRRLAVSVFNAGEQHLWVKQLPRGSLSRITFESSPNARPVWTPDGRGILYNAVNQGVGLVARRNADGTGSAEIAARLRAVPITEATQSRDGAWILARTAIGDIYGLHGADTVALLSTPALELHPRLSPDDRLLAYTSNESQRAEVYVRPFPRVQDAKWLVSTAGGGIPRWAPDGRTLYFMSSDSLMAVPVTPGSTPTFGTPRGLFATAPYLAQMFAWDVLPDGSGFVMIRLADRSEQPELVVLEGLPELARGKARP